MTNRQTTGFALSVVLIAGLALITLALIPAATRPVALAQDNYIIPTITPSLIPPPTRTPVPNPTATHAASFFRVEQAEMVSDYPNGAEFILRLKSSAGSIERVSVSYWTREGTPTSTRMEWDEARQAYVYFDRRYSPPWFEIHYQFRATDSAGNIYETEEKITEYSDPTREWMRRENDHIIVLMFGARESLADDLFQSASNAIQRLEKAFGFELDFKPYVVVMPTQQSFEEWQEYPDPYLAGQTRSDLGYTIQTLQWGESDLIDITVPHELAHIFQGFISEARDITTWFIEGNATYFETINQYDYEGRVRDIASDPNFPTLQGDISMEFPGPDGRNRLTYDVGYTFIKYWIETYGIESHRAFWQAQVTMDFHEALEFATGTSFTDLETGWRAFIGAPGAAPTLIPTPTLFAFPTAPGMPTVPPSGG